MEPSKMADMLEDLKGLFLTPGYVIDEKRLFEDDLQQINLRRVSILSFFMVAFSVLSILLCIYYCYVSGEGISSSTSYILILHASIALIFFVIYIVLQRSLFRGIAVAKRGRGVVWIFSLSSFLFLVGIASIDQYAEAVPSLGTMFFCAILIVFFRNVSDLILTFLIGLTANIVVFLLAIDQPISFFGQLANLFIFSIIFFVISRSLYFNKARELINMKQLENQRNQLNDKNSQLINIENTLSSINRNILQGLYRLDADGNLIYANDFLITLFGYGSAEKMTVDWNLRKILSKKEIYQISRAIDKKGYIKDKEIKFIKNDGSVFWGLINSSVTKVGDDVYYDGIVMDNTNRKNNEKTLENLSLVASKTDNAVFIIDKEEKIEWVNEGFMRITGYSFEEAVGIKPGILFQGENTDPKTIMQLGEKISRGESFSGELLNYRKDGSELWVHFTLNPILDEKKEIIKYVAVESDITERKNVEKELIKAKEQAEASMKAKEQFLSMVSHELRTPLNAVIGMTHLLLQEEPRDDQMQNLRTIKTSGEYLLALINDILDFSKIEAGKISIDHSIFSFKELIRNLEQTFYYQAQEKNIRFNIDVGAEVPNALIGDPIRLNQILVNLIGNSIKFTDAGYVKLSVHCDPKKNQHLLNFKITDTGIGIPTDKLDTIFERFEQVADKSKRGGTGLGLAITKSLVDLMGGKIKAESELGVGSEFTFDLCFDVCDENLLEDAKSTSYNIIDNLDNLRILLVEDNKINQLVAAKFLNQWKIKFDIADNGQMALGLTMDYKYDLILMDLQMPVMDGITAARKIRKLPGYHFVPIVALTAASLEAKDEVYHSGMNDFLIKPFNPIELYNKIKKFSNTEKSTVELGTDTFNELDISGIQKISDGDAHFLLELLNMCVDQFKNLPRQLLEALKENNFLEARSIIHKISPSIKMLQYYQLEKTTLEFNKLLKDNNRKPEDIEQKANDLIAIIVKMEKLLLDKATELSGKLLVKEDE